MDWQSNLLVDDALADVEIARLVSQEAEWSMFARWYLQEWRRVDSIELGSISFVHKAEAPTQTPTPKCVLTYIYT